MLMNTYKYNLETEKVMCITDLIVDQIVELNLFLVTIINGLSHNQ